MSGACENQDAWKILASIGHRSLRKKISGLALHLIFHRFSPFAVEVSFCRLMKGISLKICLLLF